MILRNHRWFLLLLPILALLLSGAGQVQAAPLAQDPIAGEGTYKSLCTACHTLGGGKLVGPDLAGVTERRDTDWLRRFIMEPDKMLAGADPIATELLAQYNNIPMPNLGLSAGQVEDLLAFLAAPAAAVPAPTPGGAGTAVAARAAAPAAPAPIAGGKAPSLSGYAPYGEMLFRGEVSLQGGGPACIACHSVEGVGLLGGGSLGPNLTQVHTRYGGSGLAAALGGLPFPSMQSIYATRKLTAEEQADLLAFFAQSAQRPAPQPLAKLLLILSMGGSLAGGLFLGMLFFWPRQRLSISQRLRQKGRL